MRLWRLRRLSVRAEMDSGTLGALGLDVVLEPAGDGREGLLAKGEEGLDAEVAFAIVMLGGSLIGVDEGEKVERDGATMGMVLG